MIFRKEKDLQRELTSLNFRFSEDYEALFVRREVPVGGCIPDLICIQFESYPDSNIWPSRWNYKYSFIIWLLRKWNCLYPKDIAELSYANTDKVDGMLRELIKSGAIAKKRSGELVLTDVLESVNAEVIAIEAKLQNWREAFDQAVNYKRFADKVVVAMDALGSPRKPDVLNLFKEEGVGLCAISHGSVEWQIYPEINELASGHEREYLINSVFVQSRQTLWSLRKDKNASYHD